MTKIAVRLVVVQHQEEINLCSTSGHARDSTPAASTLSPALAKPPGGC